MKFGRVALTTLLITLGLTVPVTAQLQRPSQDFFEAGWEQLEREIEILQQEPEDSEPILEESNADSEELDETSPSSSSEPSQETNPLETPSQEPDDNQVEGEPSIIH